jgi:hypothetical protein
MTIWYVRTAWWTSKAIDPHSRYEIFIAFRQEEWLQGCASLTCLYVHCLFCEVVQLNFINFSHISLPEELNFFFIFDQLTSYGIEKEQVFPKIMYILERKLL